MFVWASQSVWETCLETFILFLFYFTSIYTINLFGDANGAEITHFSFNIYCHVTVAEINIMGAIEILNYDVIKLDFYVQVPS